jgi:hypothetical protein
MKSGLVLVLADGVSIVSFLLHFFLAIFIAAQASSVCAQQLAPIASPEPAPYARPS